MPGRCRMRTRSRTSRCSRRRSTPGSRNCANPKRPRSPPQNEFIRVRHVSNPPPPTRGGRRGEARKGKPGGWGNLVPRARSRSGGGLFPRNPPTRNCSRRALAISASPRWGRRFQGLRMTSTIASKFVLAGNMRTHYLEAGSGFPLVLLHSGEFGASAELSWEFTIPALAEHFWVIAPDWLGFGESAKVFSFEDMRALRVQHIAALLKTLHIDAAHFIGNSMGGGMLASVAAQEHPLWPIERMILASAGGFAPVNEARQVLNSYDGTREHMRRILQTTLLC